MVKKILLTKKLCLKVIFPTILELWTFQNTIGGSGGGFRITEVSLYVINFCSSNNGVNCNRKYDSTLPSVVAYTALFKPEN